MQPRNKKPEYGFTYVILGLILGFFLGSGIVYWYSNRQNDSIFAYNLWDYLGSLFQGNEVSSTYVVHEENPASQNQGRRTSNTPSVLMADSTIVADDHDLFPNDSLQLANNTGGDFNPPIAITEDEEINKAKDLIAFNELIEEIAEAQSSAPEPMRIAQDQLLHIRAFNLPTQLRESAQSRPVRQLDSLLGNYPRRSGLENMMLVEFWISPLNFRGYKMSHNKLIVYGLDQVESFSIHSDGKVYFIKYFDNFYPVAQTMDFKPLTPLSDPFLLEEFQQRWP